MACSLCGDHWVSLKSLSTNKVSYLLHTLHTTNCTRPLQRGNNTQQTQPNTPEITMATTTTDGVNHRTVHVNGINMHVAEKGPEDGPVVLFVHGFPELWYSWRHQILTFSSLGYRAIAPDMRGYGGTDSPEDASKYSYAHLVGDLVGLIDHLGVEKVFLVGHDWGAIVTWWFCVFRPDRVTALVNLSVPFMPRDPNMSLLSKLHSAYGDDYYMHRFQVPGEMEAEIEEAGGVDVLLKKAFTFRTPGPLHLPKGQAFKDLEPYPTWLSEDDVAYYRNNFNKTGFTGGLNYYRALNLSWETTAPWTGVKVVVPAKFIIGDIDLTYFMPGVQPYLHKGGMKKDVPLLHDMVVLEDVGHFLQQEQPDVVSKHIHEFIQLF